MTLQDRLVGALVAMADTLVEDHDVLDFLYTLSESCVDLLDATACGVLLMDSAGELAVTAGTSFDMRSLEVFEATARQGPCFEAYRSALDVFRDHGAPFDVEQVSLSRALADMATIGILNARAFAGSQAQVRNLHQALESRATVEQAKALLAERLGLSSDEAFHLLRRHARNRNRKLRDVASQYLDGRLPDHALVEGE